jgi:hypothetical protein
MHARTQILSSRFLVPCVALIAIAATNAIAFDERSYPDFVQIQAVAPRPEGGFAIVGFLRGEGGKTPSAFLQIGANGDPVGRPSILPPPNPQHPQVWVSGLLPLLNGDYVVTGWAENQRNKPDGWMARITPNGDVVWNVTTEHAWDQRLYSVKRLSNGNLVAAGRVQQGAQETKLPSRGYAIVLDESNGAELSKWELPFGGTTTRSGFQDVTEAADGNLLFVGWMTKPDGTDDAWALKTNASGKVIKSVTFGEAGNDIAWSAIPLGTGFAIAAVLRKTREPRDPSVGSLVLFDKDLSGRTSVNLDRWVQGASQMKVVYEIPSTGQIIVAGQNGATNTADPVAIGALVTTQTSMASLEVAGAGAPISTFRAVAVDSAGNLAMVGEARQAKDRPLRGFIGVRAAAAACVPDARRVDEISAALTARMKLRHAACASPSRPARFRIGDGGKNTAVVVRPIVGDVDAYLMRGEKILDTSLNSRQRPEILPLPASGAGLEVAVTSTTPFSIFQITLVTIGSPGTDAAVAPELDAADADNQESESEDGSPLGQALRRLGFDLLGAEHAAATAGDIGVRRAIMAFQAGEGFPVTGVLAAPELVRLRGLVSREIDVDARRAAETAREVAGRLETVPASDRSGSSLRSFKGSVYNGRLYGTGELAFGAFFDGEWTINSESASDQQPIQGVVRDNSDCTIALLTATDASAGTLSGLLTGSVGVLRRGRNIILHDLEQVATATHGGDVSLATLCGKQR